MASSKTMRMFLATSAVTLAAVIAMPSKNSDTTPAAAVPASAHPDVPAHAISERVVEPTHEAIDLVARVAEMEWGRDPFLRPGGAERRMDQNDSRLAVETSLSLPSLTGISHHAGEFMAILDEQIVEPGVMTTTGFRVESIDRRSVTLLLAGSQHTLLLSEGR